ncbi:MAG: dihydrolipoamide acetyltransferase family protein [Planctomycetota bacterium]|jgi:2-oxoglutarate dehydrogenase E2 component (dihydrolipoamide succinyltransferase)
MATKVVMPQMGESIAEGTITKWLKSVGDKIDKDEPLLEISTDKVDTEIPAPAAGILGKILVEEGQTVEVGTDLAVILAEGEKIEEAAFDEAPPAVLEHGPGAEPAPAPPPPPPPPAPAPAPVAVAAAPGRIPRESDGRFYSPLVRSIAETEGLHAGELAAIPGSGAGGRVTKGDLLGYLQSRTAAPAAAAAVPAPMLGAAPADQVVPMDRMRSLIAEHMVASLQTSAHVYILTDCDMTKIVQFREQHKESFLERTGEKLTFTPFFVKASALALRDFPYVNAQINPAAGQVTVKGQVNVGMAVAVPRDDGTYGLIVPVIRDADMLPLREIARQVNDLSVRGREGRLQPEEPQGGTFTVTNMGVFGNYGGLAIINQPQVAILGLGAIEKRPAVVDDEIVIRHKVFMTVSIDHRLVDGALGGQFLERIRWYLENFETWILA